MVGPLDPSSRLPDAQRRVSPSKKLPTGRIGRMRRLVGVGLRAGADMVRERSEGAAAQKAAEVLGQMRGVAAKVGQMAGYVDGVVPEGQREAYERWMKTLLEQAPSSSPEAVRERVLEQLGMPLDEAFAEFEEQPVASASIGQVHRARLLDGREVAVKIQHPGVDKAMDADLDNIKVLEPMFALFAGAQFESKRIAGEIRDRFREEIDYELEARRQLKMAEIHAGDPSIKVPGIVASHSGPRIITMDWVEGLSFAEAAEAPEDLRRQWAETMWRFVYKGVLVGGHFNADPHPGNYKFHDDGTVTFLDHGCVQEADARKRAEGSAAHIAACRGDRPAFEQACREMMKLRGGEFERASMEYLYEAFAPQLHAPYKIERHYVAGLAKRFKDTFQEIRKLEDDSYVAFEPGVFFLNRLQFGFYSVLARLDVEVDYARVELEFLSP